MNEPTAHYQIEVQVRAEDDNEKNLPAVDVLTQGIWDGLPKEWFDYQDENDYKIVGMVGVQPGQWGLSLAKQLENNRAMLADANRMIHHNEKQLEISQARLAEANRLIHHNENLIDDYVKKIEKLEDVGRKLADKLVERRHDLELQRHKNRNVVQNTQAMMSAIYRVAAGHGYPPPDAVDVDDLDNMRGSLDDAKVALDELKELIDQIESPT